MHKNRRLLSFVLVPLLLSAVPATAQTTVELFRDDFESGASRWTFEGHWTLMPEGHPCAPEPMPSGTHAAWYGNRIFDCCCTYAGITDFMHFSLSTPIPLPSAPSTLRFESRSSISDDPSWDTRTVEISPDGGTTWEEVFRNQTVVEPWTSYAVDLSPYAGLTIQVRFVFWAGDSIGNDDLGWLVDDVRIESTSDYPIACLGDGSATACPCGNASPSAAGAGCLNSNGTAGALRATGSASLSDDTLRLWGSGMMSTTVVYYQGASLTNGGAGNVYGDGLNCTGGPIRRLASTANVVGHSNVPLQGGDAISVRGQVAAPGTRWYQARYRNAASFCTPATFNSTNQVRVDWTL